MLKKVFLTFSTRCAENAVSGLLHFATAYSRRKMAAHPCTATGCRKIEFSASLLTAVA
jgi:hypothetical protein